VPSENGAWNTFYPAFARAVRGLGPVPVEPRDAIASATVLDAARQAFVAGMQLSSAIAAIVGVGLAILTLVVLRDEPAASDEDAAQPEPDRPDHDARDQRRHEEGGRPEHGEQAGATRPDTTCARCGGRLHPATG
jgi:hypothetical protein